MKHITVLVPPGIRNIGNSFISLGAIRLIRKCLSYYDKFKVEEIEALETSNKLFNYPTKVLPEYNKKRIEDSDRLIVIGGSCLSRYFVNFFEEIKQLKVPKILLGAGFYEGIDKELELHKDLPFDFDYIFVRDQETWKALSQDGHYKNVISSIDLAFWLNLKPFKIEEVKPYSVVNIDSPERGIQERLYNEHENSVMSRNDSSKTSICNSEFGKKYNCFVAERPNEYLKLYANAEHVATNRIHTFLACILSGTSCQPFIDYTASYERFFLFKQIGLVIETAKIYTKKDYKKYLPKLERMKARTEGLLTDILK